MSEQVHTELSSLWQAQTVNDIDLAAVKQGFMSQRKKQRLYMAVDIGAFIPALFLLYHFWSELSFTVKAVNLTVGVIALPLLIYQLWLRRVAAFSRNVSTLDHLDVLTKQIKNNVRIAIITKHSTWISMVLVMLTMALQYVVDDVSTSKLSFMFGVLAATAFIMGVWYVWAAKREQRFRRQLDGLKIMRSSQY
tara:strand:- start:57 stop:635 length:579 start_codon:yes stop_codon:yes gene_type:complete